MTISDYEITDLFQLYDLIIKNNGVDIRFDIRNQLNFNFIGDFYFFCDILVY